MGLAAIAGRGQRASYRPGGYLDWFSASTLVENNIVYNTKSGGLQFNAGDDNHFFNNVVVGDGKAWNANWQKANAQGTRDERNLVIPDLAAESPLRNARQGDFELRKEFSGYPGGFAWIDVAQIGLQGQATGESSLGQMAREGGVLGYDQPGSAALTGPWRKETGRGFWGN